MVLTVTTGQRMPRAIEIPYNGADDDCNLATPDDDLDLDGVELAENWTTRTATSIPMR